MISLLLAILLWPTVSMAADMRLSLHDTYASWYMPDGCYDNQVITVSGSALRASFGDTLSQFLAYTQQQITDQFNSYLATSPIDPATDSIVVLDMENPAGIHPKDWHLLSEPDKTNVMNAFKTRINVARAALPNAKLSLYGVGFPTPTGVQDQTYTDRLAAYQAASALGVFDNLTYLSPVLYLRYGPSDPSFSTIAAYTRQGLEMSRLVTKSTGAQFRLVPMMHPKVFNGGSLHHDTCRPLSEHQTQLNEIKKYLYVERLVYWVGVPTGPTDAYYCGPLQFIADLEAAQ